MTYSNNRIEAYGDMENDASDAYATHATITTTRRPGSGALNQGMDTVLLSSEVLKATSGNGARRLKAKQETRVATRATKTAEAAMKQIAAQELEAEKLRIQEWKQQVMAEVVHKLQGIRTAYIEEMEAQRQSFQTELEGVIERLKQACWNRS